MSAYNFNEIKRLSNRLAAHAKLKLEYAAVANKTRKVLLVEGATDNKFVSHIKSDVVDCINADHVFNRETFFRESSPKHINSKNAIAQLIFGITKIPSPFIVYPDDIDKWDLYGMVDLDCDEISSGECVPRLLVTDTHDLETLLISTDKNVFDNIDNCSISKEDIAKAYFVAFQLATARALLDKYYNDQTFNLQVISCGSYTVDFSAFVYDYKANIIDLVKYIIKHSESDLTTKKVNQLVAEIGEDKHIKKKFNTDGLWKQELSTFDLKSTTDFWTSVNGHDILQLIQYYNESAYATFHGGDGTTLNRKFEMAIIEKYDYSMITSTNLYAKMKSAGLTNSKYIS